MSEFQEHALEPVAPLNPFEGIIAGIARKGQELQAAQAHLQGIESERDAAMAAAALPFEGPLNEARVSVAALEHVTAVAAVEGRLRDMELHPLARTALDLELRRSRISVGSFATKLKERALQQSRGREVSTEQVINTFVGFEGFRRTLEEATSPVPVAVIALNWFEQIDIQAEHEGRPSHTGEYDKECSVYVGTATSDDLEISRENVADGGDLAEILRPVSIDLQLQDATLVRTEYDWGEPIAETVTAVNETVTLVRGSAPAPSFNMLNQGEIRWHLSEALDFSMTGSDYSSRSYREPKALFFVYADKVAEALQVLSADSDIPQTVRDALSQVPATPAQES